MNRGSQLVVGRQRRARRGFNEAPIHESGKSTGPLVNLEGS